MAGRKPPEMRDDPFKFGFSLASKRGGKARLALVSDGCDGYCIRPDGTDGGPCGARTGELHGLGCDHEWCSQCGDQYLYCECAAAIDYKVASAADLRPRVPYDGRFPSSYQSPTN
jgi:hypothetical protein